MFSRYVRMDSKEEVNIGLILGPFGVKGELKIMPLTDDPSRITELTDVLVGKENEESQPYNVLKVRVHKNLVIIKLKGINTREESIVLKNSYLRISRSQLKELGEDQFYISDLEGMDVYLQDGSRLGNIKEVIKTGANDIYSVTGDKKTYLIPAIKEVIKMVDVENKKIVIEPIVGLLDLEG